MPADKLGVSVDDGPERGAQAAYHDPAGIPAEVKESAYLLSDGVTLLGLVPVYDAGGPVGQDSVGRPVDAWPLTAEFAPPPDEFQWVSMIAGDSGDWVGFSSGDIVSPPFNPPVGSISAEPSATHKLLALYQDPGSSTVTVIFQGTMDHVGLRLRIGRVYTGNAIAVQWPAGNTEIVFMPEPQLEPGVRYDVGFIRV